MAQDEWREANRANWDERVAVHLAAPGDGLGRLRAGRKRLDPLVEGELGPVAGLRILHLQCHFGLDTLTLLQYGAASVVGLEFSGAAIAAARALAAEVGLADRARFIEADLYAAPAALPEPASFDLVFVTWGALCWLPDIAGWARVVAHFLRPGGRLYLAEGHPAAYVFDDAATADGRPGWFVPYFQREALVLDDPTDYVDPTARLRHAETHTWLHPLGEVLRALREAGLALDWLNEHPRIAWQMFRCLVRDADGLWTWPDRQWLPLAYSLAAHRQPGLG